MIETTEQAIMGNGQATELDSIAVLDWPAFRVALVEQVSAGGRISAYFGNRDGAAVMLYAAIARDSAGKVHLLRTRIEGKSFESLARQFPQIQLFEREIAEQFGLRPEGHPWLKPVRCQPADDDFYRLDGEEIHEVAVGPVHAGIIEPGHFRFQCYGEHVYHLEIALGYQHRGIERAMVGAPDKKSLHLAETIAGDTSVGHASAYCRAIEALSSVNPPIRGQAIRGIALELERIANHVGDLGALAGDVGFLPAMSYCGRIRGDLLNMTAAICGSRFGRNLIRPGGVAFNIEPTGATELVARLDEAYSDLSSAVDLLWNSPSVMARLEETGIVSEATAREIGLVGPAARACGLDQDVRRDFPFSMFRFNHIPLSTWHTGDVFARAYVRWLEIQQSVEFIREQLRQLPDGPTVVAPKKPGSRKIALSMVEGWRGEICHMAITDEDGRIVRYKVVDPSFHNWFGLAQALRNQAISDFPLCNKSFNLSYCGHDL